MEYNLWNPGWGDNEKQDAAILSYGTVVVRIPYTFIHHLGNIWPIATKGSHLRNLDLEFIKALEEIEWQMRKKFWPTGAEE